MKRFIGFALAAASIGGVAACKQTLAQPTKEWRRAHADKAAMAWAKMLIEAQLLAPKTAEYVTGRSIQNKGGGNYYYGALVDAQNRYGVFLRHLWSCELTTQDGATFNGKCTDINALVDRGSVR